MITRFYFSSIKISEAAEKSGPPKYHRSLLQNSGINLRRRFPLNTQIHCQLFRTLLR
ncbi:hypothetical protein V2J09_021010 [Rumex salicifolius]